VDPHDQVLDGAARDRAPKVDRNGVAPLAVEASHDEIEAEVLRTREPGGERMGLPDRRPRRVGKGAKKVSDRFRELRVGRFRERQPTAGPCLPVVDPAKTDTGERPQHLSGHLEEVLGRFDLPLVQERGEGTEERERFRAESFVLHVELELNAGESGRPVERAGPAEAPGPLDGRRPGRCVVASGPPRTSGHRFLLALAEEYPFPAAAPVPPGHTRVRGRAYRERTNRGRPLAHGMDPPSDPAVDRSRHLERWLTYPRCWTPRVRADGRSLFVLSNQDGVPKVWTVPPTGGPLRPFWAIDERVGNVLPSRDGPRVVVASDRGGNELWELTLVGDDGERIRKLTDRPDRIHEPGAWRDRQHFLYTSNERDIRFFDVYERDVDAETPGRLLRQEDALVSVAAARGDVAVVERSNTNLDVDLLVLERGRERHLNPHDGEAVVFGVDLAGTDVYAATNPDREFAAFVRFPVAGGSSEVIREFSGDVERLRTSPDQRRVAGTTNDRGWSRLWVYDVGSSEFTDLPLPTPGVVDSFAWAPDGSELFYDLSSAETGTEVFAVDPSHGRTRAVTSSPDAMPGPAHSPELRSFRAEDGLTVDYWEYLPEGRAHGTILYVHGGPEAQGRPTFNPVLHFLVAEGFRLLAPNVRGSLGYGRRFLHLDDVRLRMDSVRDLRDLVRSLGDSGPIGVVGGSYGGFMVLSALTTYPELWAAGVDIVGIANFVTFLERTGPWRRKVREDEYGSLERDREFLESISPLNHVDQIRTPLLVVHGANDPRVPVFEAEQIVAALQRRSIPVEYLRFENEGHGLVRRENQVAAYSRAAEFLLRYLRPASAVGAPVKGA
jgi:dipeptidyl aminopeptidase/acylaminoacyl peptidase